MLGSPRVSRGRCVLDRGVATAPRLSRPHRLWHRGLRGPPDRRADHARAALARRGAFLRRGLAGPADAGPIALEVLGRVERLVRIGPGAPARETPRAAGRCSGCGCWRESTRSASRGSPGTYTRSSERRNLTLPEPAGGQRGGAWLSLRHARGLDAALKQPSAARGMPIRAKGFRRLKGHAGMPLLPRVALAERRDVGRDQTEECRSIVIG